MNPLSSWSELHARLHKTLRQRQLIPLGSRFLIAVSGGQDSLCLTKLLFDLQSKWQWQIAIAHCDHCWSTDRGIADHVYSIAQNFGLPFYLKINPHPHKESEAIAREWRYQALTEIALQQGFNLVVTGHTQSDVSETLLYNLIRGAGTDGLVSLNWQRCLSQGISLIRPLLNVSRQETGKFCQDFQLPIWYDQVNDNLRYARNRIRNVVLPYLQDNFNPQVEKTLAQTVEVLREEVLLLQNLATEALQQSLVENKTALNRSVLKNKPLALQRRVIRLFFESLLKKTPNFQQIEQIVHLINAPNKSSTSSLPGNAIATVEDNWIVMKKC